MIRKINISLLLLSIAEGLISLGFLFYVPSMEKNAFLLGYSLPRIMVGLILLLIVLPLIFIFVKVIFDMNWSGNAVGRLGRFIEKDDRFLITITSLFSMFIGGIACIFFFSSEAAVRLEMINVVFDRAFSILLYLILLSFQSILFLSINYFDLYKQTYFFNIEVVFNTFLILLIITATIFNALVLALNINLYNQIPYWYWKFWDKDFNPAVLFFMGAVFLMALGSLQIVTKQPEKTWRNLVLLVILGLIFQYGFGFIEGQGIESIRLKFVKAGHNAYAENASFQPDILESMVNYDEIYGEEMYLDTKPPGTLLFNLLVQRISNLINPVDNFDLRYERMTTFMAYVFPLLSLMPLFLIFFFSKSFLCARDAYLACLAYIFLPNVTLMVLELDQVLFPLLFIGGLALWKIAMHRQSPLWAFITGLYCYFCVFITYSLLPMIGLMVFWYVFDFFLYPERRSWPQAIKMAAGLIGGLLISALLYRLGINYDILRRYHNSMVRHHFHKQYDSGGNTQMQMLLLNNLEFAVWSGMPLFLFYISRTIKAVISLIKKKMEKMDVFILAFFLMYVVLNLIGQTRSEVGRLWIFLLPVVVLISVDEIINIFKNKKLGMIFFLILQLLTVLVTYQFQDAINL